MAWREGLRAFWRQLTAGERAAVWLVLACLALAALEGPLEAALPWFELPGELLLYASGIVAWSVAWMRPGKISSAVEEVARGLFFACVPATCVGLLVRQAMGPAGPLRAVAAPLEGRLLVSVPVAAAGTTTLVLAVISVHVRLRRAGAFAPPPDLRVLQGGPADVAAAPAAGGGAVKESAAEAEPESESERAPGHTDTDPLSSSP